MLGIGRKVADGGEATAGHDRVGDNVNVFVNLARLKAAVQMNMPVAGDELAVDGVGELPFGARNDACAAPRASRAP